MTQNDFYQVKYQPEWGKIRGGEAKSPILLTFSLFIMILN
jgi:hypothetical protein